MHVWIIAIIRVYACISGLCDAGKIRAKYGHHHAHEVKLSRFACLDFIYLVYLRFFEMCRL